MIANYFIFWKDALQLNAESKMDDEQL